MICFSCAFILISNCKSKLVRKTMQSKGTVCMDKIYHPKLWKQFSSQHKMTFKRKKRENRHFNQKTVDILIIIKKKPSIPFLLPVLLIYLGLSCLPINMWNSWRCSSILIATSLPTVPTFLARFIPLLESPLTMTMNFLSLTIFNASLESFKLVGPEKS